ncbi:hypothetical protein M8C21_021812 [Ambrosia artemisiifolia]|uniref:Uncharacterized protein n=1 Tax=Ambrosia artemisiifolia TaxID=4212 RepID=A0AAD5BQK9_AMBAR|nr:hypothetical protein M8C21_021812 [Ambrosia artemisiifolia]
MATVTGNLMNPTPIFIDAATIKSVLPYKSLINHLQTSLSSATSVIESPIRHSHPTSSSSTLLLMPAWSLSSTTLPYIGVKLVTTHPNNSSLNLPGVHASYVLFHSLTGQTLASMDGTEITVRRTACVSALASHYLSHLNSQVLLMIGAGSLAPHLIKAHLTTRPSINRVMIWNRTWLKAGAHLDLVGSYKPSMRECDDEAVKRGRVFVDNEAALVEAGELVGAFERGVMKKEEIEGDLVELTKGVKIGRKDEKEITLFVSVGSAVVDLLSAQLAYETIRVKP